ncbi:ABC transporter substrate-binding protein [Nibricoccus aquaticus]|uniref:ABC transporter substrate-binding protein n=2 Tax=Nibricoccus aquaticus TaxID=2576891 RepID=A0A290QI05_9BACT|nr:ABC transporter substrate-binding protein [Nibricoccus aquaticus]
MRWNRWLLGVTLGVVTLAGAAGVLNAAPLRVVSTTAMVNDLVKRVGGAEVSAEVLMGPGVDPHLYKATAADMLRLNRAEVVFYSGLMLEGKMTDVFTRMAKSGKRVNAITAGLPEAKLLKPADFEGHPDPHVWFDVELWAMCVDVVEARLVEASPERKAVFAANAEKARGELAELHAWAKAKAAELQVEKRVLVTSHDAYNYFGRAYGFQVVGLQGISTVSEAALADVAKLTDFIKQRGLKAVFVESSVSHTTIERIAKDSGVTIGGELFSDAMGAAGKIENGYDVGTYEGMIKHNLNTIVEALK